MNLSHKTTRSSHDPRVHPQLLHRWIQRPSGKAAAVSQTCRQVEESRCFLFMHLRTTSMYSKMIARRAPESDLLPAHSWRAASRGSKHQKPQAIFRSKRHP